MRVRVVGSAVWLHVDCDGSRVGQLEPRPGEPEAVVIACCGPHSAVGSESDFYSFSESVETYLLWAALGSWL